MYATPLTAKKLGDHELFKTLEQFSVEGTGLGILDVPARTLPGWRTRMAPGTPPKRT